MKNGKICRNFEARAVQKYINLVDLAKSFLTSIFYLLAKSASIQRRTSLSKFLRGSLSFTMGNLNRSSRFHGKRSQSSASDPLFLLPDGLCEWIFCQPKSYVERSKTGLPLRPNESDEKALLFLFSAFSALQKRRSVGGTSLRKCTWDTASRRVTFIRPVWSCTRSWRSAFPTAGQSISGEKIDPAFFFSLNKSLFEQVF